MRRALIATGVLGTGTALTFAAAVLASALFPSGSLVYNQQPWAVPMRGWAEPMPGGWAEPMPGKAPPVPGDGGGWNGAEDGGWGEAPGVDPGAPGEMPPPPVDATD
jgi:hypothetical protein